MTLPALPTYRDPDARDPYSRFAGARATLARLRSLRATLRQPIGEVIREFGAPTTAPADPQVPSPSIPPPRRPGWERDSDARRMYRTPVEEAELQDEDPKPPRHLCRSVWRTRVGYAPSCEAGDRETAAAYAQKLRDALDTHLNYEGLDDGTAPLTRSEAQYLRSQIAKWERRAAGLDPRFERLGTRGGRERR